MSDHDDPPAPRRCSQTPHRDKGHDAASGGLTAGRATSAELKRLRRSAMALGLMPRLPRAQPAARFRC
jgi:hypothetical protein